MGVQGVVLTGMLVKLAAKINFLNTSTLLEFEDAMDRQVYGS